MRRRVSSCRWAPGQESVNQHVWPYRLDRKLRRNSGPNLGGIACETDPSTSGPPQWQQGMYSYWPHAPCSAASDGRFPSGGARDALRGAAWGTYRWPSLSRRSARPGCHRPGGGRTPWRLAGACAAGGLHRGQGAQQSSGIRAPGQRVLRPSWTAPASDWHHGDQREDHDLLYYRVDSAGGRQSSWGDWYSELSSRFFVNSTHPPHIYTLSLPDAGRR